MNNNALHVLYCGDHVYFQGIYLCALSACRRTKCPLIFHLMTMTVNDEKRHWKPIDEEELNVFKKMIKEFNPLNDAYLYDVTDVYQETIAKSANHNNKYSPYALVRLFAEQFLPSEIETLIYMDADTLVNSSLEAFKEYDMTNYELGACLDFLGEWWLGSDYFNSGVLLMNMKMIRETKLLQRCRDLVLNKKMFFADQDALNRLVKHLLYLPRKFNEQRYNDRSKTKRDTVISHYPSHVWHFWDPVRPWQIHLMHHRYKIYSFDEDYVYFLKNFPFEKLSLKRIEVDEKELPLLCK